MTRGLPELEAWFETGSQRLYGDDAWPDQATAAEAWLMAGGPHHTALTSSLGSEPLADLADIANLVLVEIDADCKPAAFRRELRWNHAYYFLDRGV